MTSRELRHLFQKYMKEPDKDKAHAKLSASGSERWLSCPGSVKLSEGIPSVDNEHSVRGTRTHTLLQFMLENEHFSGMLTHPVAQDFKEHIQFDEAMFYNALFAAQEVIKEKVALEKQTGHPVELLVEEKLELEGVGFGTADIILYQPFGTLHVMDYKNGQKAVEPEHNTQGLYYAVAAADRFGWDFSRATITIIQPNAVHSSGPVRSWRTTPEMLEKKKTLFQKGAALTKKKDAPLVANSGHCFFCPAKNICPLQMKAKESKIMERFAPC